MSDIKQISATSAYEMIKNKPQTVFVDVRSSMEFLFVGHAKGSNSIPWIDEPDWKIDPHFATHIRQLTLGGAHSSDEEGVPIILICRSGHRSLEAGIHLIKEGFEDVYNIDTGFEGDLDENHHRGTLGGWRFEGLPWEQG
ncbi:MAG: rhodanese-like domain-containing protein [Gammaproteobacteria bacterium]|nr:rhodanese-like domain-containing protein [Gammaproteobacteria bacterium]